MLVKQYFLGLMRRRSMQPVWQLLSHLSAMGLNHWATHLSFSGELSALKKLSLIIPPGTVAFDVGANHGDYSLAVLEILRPQKIYAFEPSSAAFEILRSKVDENVVKPIRIGVGSEPGKATLHNSTPGASIGSMLDLRSPFAPFDPTFDETVEVTTVDIFCQQHGIECIGLLKIDVEGMEFEVLKGAISMIDRGAITSIQFEFGVGNVEARVFLRDFFDLLGGKYDLFRIVSDGLWPLSRYSPELERSLPINYVAVLRKEHRMETVPLKA